MTSPAYALLCPQVPAVGIPLDRLVTFVGTPLVNKILVFLPVDQRKNLAGWNVIVTSKANGCVFSLTHSGAPSAAAAAALKVLCTDAACNITN